MDRFSIVLLLCLYRPFQITEGQTATKLTCTEVGAFEIDDGTCKNYYICLDDGEKLIPVTLSCASSAMFDSSLGRCMPENKTTCHQTTTTAVSTTTSAPLCFKYGRFPIKDKKCKKYYLCYWDGNHYTIMDNLACPLTLVFQPTLGICVPSLLYKCPSE